jgi:hypothetical protein
VSYACCSLSAPWREGLLGVSSDPSNSAIRFR